MGAGAGRLHDALPRTGRLASSADRGVGGRRVGGLRHPWPVRAATPVAAAYLDRSMADSPGAALVSGAVCALRSALSCRALPDAGTARAAAGGAVRDLRKAGCLGGGVFGRADRCWDGAVRNG